MFNVAFVTYGIKTPQGKCMHQHALNNPTLFHPPFDVRTLLRRDPQQKPLFKVKHTENGDFTTTQISMLNDQQFFKTAANLVKTVHKSVLDPVELRVQPIYCNQGIHRCDTVTKYVMNKVLNQVNDGNNGGRRYNAKIFDAQSVAADGVVNIVCEHAISWLSRPFKVMDPVATFGDEAAQYSLRTIKQNQLFVSLVSLLETGESTVLDKATFHVTEDLSH